MCWVLYKHSTGVYRGVQDVTAPGVGEYYIILIFVFPRLIHKDYVMERYTNLYNKTDLIFYHYGSVLLCCTIHVIKYTVYKCTLRIHGYVTRKVKCWHGI